MEVVKPQRIRLLSGPPAIVEHEVNLLLDEYAAVTWSFAVAKDEVVVTVLMIHAGEIRKAQLAQAGNSVAVPPPRFRS